MSDAEIRGKVTGMEITDEAHFSEQYMRDGTVRVVNLGRQNYRQVEGQRRPALFRGAARR